MTVASQIQIDRDLLNEIKDDYKTNNIRIPRKTTHIPEASLPLNSDNAPSPASHPTPHSAPNPTPHPARRPTPRPAHCPAPRPTTSSTGDPALPAAGSTAHLFQGIIIQQGLPVKFMIAGENLALIRSPWIVFWIIPIFHLRCQFSVISHNKEEYHEEDEESQEDKSCHHTCKG